MLITPSILFVLCGAALVLYSSGIMRRLSSAHFQTLMPNTESIVADAANLGGGWLLLIVGTVSLLLDAPHALSIAAIGLVAVVIGNIIAFRHD
ncbi:MAG: hypothetical protein H7175_21420 [Burkholderiales bacterium]|nr:hypothetical protein [Anaerolineae bacterium]